MLPPVPDLALVFDFAVDLRDLPPALLTVRLFLKGDGFAEGYKPDFAVDFLDLSYDAS